jgi:hypothetical protein
MPLLRPTASDFTATVKAVAQYIAPGATAKSSRSGGGMLVAPPSLGAIARASQVGALMSPTTSAVNIGGVTRAVVAGAGPFGPLSISECTLWFDAFDASYAATGNTITAWTNKSGKASATTGVGTVSKNQATLNGKSSVRFAAGINYLSIGPVTYLTNFRSFFIVGNFPNAYDILYENADSYGGQIDTSGGAISLNYPGRNMLVTLTPTGFFGSPCILSISSSTGNAGIWVNGTSQTIALNNLGTSIFTPGTTVAGTTCLGGASAFSNGASVDMYEFIQYDGILTLSDRLKIEGYLAWKWGLQSSLPPGHTYKLSAPI